MSERQNTLVSFRLCAVYLIVACRKARHLEFTIDKLQLYISVGILFILLFDNHADE